MFVRPAAPAAIRRLAYVALAVAATLVTSVTVSEPAHAATTTESGAASSVLKMLNAERAANHLPALSWSTALVSSARRHNLSMAGANLLSHQLHGEAYFSTRISQAGVQWHSVAENIGWTTDRTARGANGLETSMYNEKAPNDGHRVNILSRSVRYVGIDTLIDARTGKLWLTEDFADVAGPAARPAVATVNHNPIGYLDSATVLPGHKVRLNGWAADPDNNTLPLWISIYYDSHMDGHYKSGVYRPDVARVHHTGAYQGFSITIPLPAGVHTVSTYAINIGSGSVNPRLGSKTVRV